MKRRIRNYNLLSGYAFYVPGPWDIFALTALFLVGALIGNVIGLLFMLALPESGSEYMMLISYPVMFIPPMMYAMYKSRGNALFDTGYEMDSRHFGKFGTAAISILVMLSTLALAFDMDMVNALMPPMPEWLENMLKGMTQGKFWVNFLCVSVFAPFFEEWLCRGMILRGLLNYSRSEGRRGIRPAAAIAISALFFAAIHLNPWQAVPAFALGCLFGYVYYRTGSLNLTMLMHFTNNTFALIISNIDSIKDAENFMEVMPGWAYNSIAAVCLVFLVFAVREFSKIELTSPQGNCDEVKTIG
ncbi:MAG: type II CAAX endopeptidase family protein [Candidatus Cryptobacteroides sp.]|nr:type II CAAX endopeptidase family protein [Candidatus Cryptobacteroides sp.]